MANLANLANIEGARGRDSLPLETVLVEYLRWDCGEALEGPGP